MGVLLENTHRGRLGGLRYLGLFLNNENAGAGADRCNTLLGHHYAHHWWTHQRRKRDVTAADVPDGCLTAKVAEPCSELPSLGVSLGPARPPSNSFESSGEVPLGTALWAGSDDHVYLP